MQDIVATPADLGQDIQGIDYDSKLLEGLLSFLDVYPVAIHQGAVDIENYRPLHSSDFFSTGLAISSCCPREI